MATQPAEAPIKPVITLEGVDQQLAELQPAVTAAVANVYELYEHPVYRALAGSSHAAPLPVVGTTREQAERACESIRHLLLCSTELQGVLTRARELRDAMPLMFREEKLRALDHLLCGTAVELPASEVPLAQRGLLSSIDGSARPAVTLRDMLARLAPEFEAAKQTILAVDEAWSTLGARLDASEARLAELRALSAESDAGDALELDEIAQRIARGREQVKLDPLGAARSLDASLDATLEQARAKLAGVVAEQRQTRADLARARALCGELLEAHARATAAVAERALKTTDTGPAPTPPLSEERIEELRGWLEQLDRMMSEPARRHSVYVGVRHWLEKAAQSLAHEQTAGLQNRAPVDERLELRGRLDALMAKAAGSSLAEDADLSADAQAARALLYQRPTPMERARELVARYQARLNEKLRASTR